MNFYLNKHRFLPSQISAPPRQDLGIIVVIPCFNEKMLLRALDSLENCDPTLKSTEVIIVLNSSEDASEEIISQNLETATAFDQWNHNKKLNYYLIYVPDLPKKHAGVGLARKIGMDEAVDRFDQISRDGIIICFDADCTCDRNYLKEIELHFDHHAKTPGCAVYFEHPVSGEEFNNTIYQGIVNYELHLRYYKQCKEWCGLPYAYHTVGSSMAVRSSAYQKQGGMNKRKAGEDFYFLHKIISLSGFTELNSTRVFPSPRPSERVPFGTGRAIQKWLEGDNNTYLTYNFQIFIEIKKFVEMIPAFHQFDTSGLRVLPEPFLLFLKDQEFEMKLKEIIENSTDLSSFKRRFFVWFDAFKVLKLVHHLRDAVLPDRPVLAEVELLLAGTNEQGAGSYDSVLLLTLMRQRDRNPSADLEQF